MRTGGREQPDSHEDVRLSQLYQQVTELQAPRFEAGYDLEKGVERYRAWLGEPNGHAEALPPDAFAVSGTARAEWSPDRAVIELYSQHYRALVRLAALLVRDTPTAEEVVQDSFVAMNGGWQRLRDTEKALAYLRQAVVNRSRSVLRHRTVVDKNLQKAPPDMPSAEHGALVLLERSAVVAALREPAGPAARGDRAAVLRGPVRGRDRRRDEDQPRRGQEPHRARHDRPAHRPGAGMTAGAGPTPGRQGSEPGEGP